MYQWMRDARESPVVRRELSRERRDWVMKQAGVNPTTSAPVRRGPGGGF
jgi:hypothetical protein